MNMLPMFSIYPLNGHYDVDLPDTVHLSLKDYRYCVLCPQDSARPVKHSLYMSPNRGSSRILARPRVDCILVPLGPLDMLRIDEVNQRFSARRD